MEWLQKYFFYNHSQYEKSISVNLLARQAFYENNSSTRHKFFSSNYSKRDRSSFRAKRDTSIFKLSVFTINKNAARNSIGARLQHGGDRRSAPAAVVESFRVQKFSPPAISGRSRIRQHPTIGRNIGQKVKQKQLVGVSNSESSCYLSVSIQ